MSKKVFFSIFIMFGVMFSNVLAYDGYISSGGSAPNGRLYYKIVNGSAIITYPGSVWFEYNPYSPAGDIAIPNYITHNGTSYPVTSIDTGAFDDAINLTSVVFPNSITMISRQAFWGCRQLSSVTMGENVTTIEKWAFMQCPLTSVTIGENTLSVASNDTTRGTARIDLPETTSWDNALIISWAWTAYHYHFDHWSNGSTAERDTLYISGDCSLMAYFVPNKYVITVDVNDINNGSVYFPNGDTADFGDTVMVVANPAECYQVTNWDVDSVWDGVSDTSYNFVEAYHCSDKKDTIWIVVLDNRIITCNFAIDTNTLSVISNDSLMGYASVNGSTFADVICGEEIEILATANEGYHFDHWSTGSNDNPLTITATSDTTIVAYFAIDGGSEGIDDCSIENISISVAEGRIIVLGTEAEIHIFDMTGRLMVNGILPNGVYFVKIGNHSARKVVVIR